MTKIILAILMLAAPYAWAVNVLEIDPAKAALSFQNGSRYGVELKSGTIPSPTVKIAARTGVDGDDYFSVTSRFNQNIAFGLTEIFTMLLNSKGNLAVYLNDSTGARITASRCNEGFNFNPTLRARINLHATTASFVTTNCPEVEYQVSTTECSPGCTLRVEASGTIAQNTQIAVTAVTPNGVSVPNGLADYAIAKYSGNGNIVWEIPFIIVNSTEQLYDFTQGTTSTNVAGTF